jgi:hypothetical protein
MYVVFTAHIFCCIRYFCIKLANVVAGKEGRNYVETPVVSMSSRRFNMCAALDFWDYLPYVAIVQKVEIQIVDVKM